MADAEWAWPRYGAYSMLAQFVTPAAYEDRGLIPPDIEALRRDTRTAAQAPYENLLERLLWYDLEPLRPGVAEQSIREPETIFRDQHATCLDLALLYSGVYLAARLRPFIAVFSRGDTDHALVVVRNVPADAGGTDCGQTPGPLRDRRVQAQSRAAAGAGRGHRRMDGGGMHGLRNRGRVPVA